MIPAELQRPILERAEGNPLYAEEFVRLLKDKNLLIKKGSSWELKEGAEVPFPDSIQALIAARLDSLPADAKSLLADAAVIGKVFWAGAVAAMGERDLTAVTDTLRELSRKEFVRPARRSSVEGEAEYAFWHILTRDVAYSQLPRASRASRHVAAARWIESKAPERIQDMADVLAYHYSTALDLARAAEQTEQASDLEAPALRFLSLAGERALGLETAAALSYLERALALTPAGHPERPAALARFGRAALQAGHMAEAAEALEEAVTSFRARGDLAAAALAMGRLAHVLRGLGDPRWARLPSEALDLLQPLGPSQDLAGALSEVAAADALQSRFEEAIRTAEQALEMAAELGLSPPSRALGFRAMARCGLGDPEGLEDYRAAIALASQAGRGLEVATLYNNLGMAFNGLEGPAATLEANREGIAYATARGLTAALELLTANTADSLIDAGELDEALAIAAEVAERAEARGDVNTFQTARQNQIEILVLQGRAEETAGWLDPLEASIRQWGSVDALVSLLLFGLARAALGQEKAASALLTEVESNSDVRADNYYSKSLPAMVRAALKMQEPELAAQLASGVAPRTPYAGHSLAAANAALTETRGDLQGAAEAYADAADRWERFGVVPEHAFALLGQGRCLLGLSRPTEATLALQHAREIFQRLKAAPALAETDELLQRASALSS